MPDLSFLTFQDLLGRFFSDPAVEEEVLRRYHTQAAILVVDFTDMVKRTDAEGIVYALALAQAAERAMYPAVRAHGGELVKRVADTFFAVFPTPQSALAAATDGLALAAAFNAERTGVIGDGTRTDAIHPCLGLGCGRTLVIPGEDIYGDEVNRAFVLGEDTAGPKEILCSQGFLAAIGDLPVGIGSFLAPADRREETGFDFHVLVDHR